MVITRYHALRIVRIGLGVVLAGGGLLLGSIAEDWVGYWLAGLLLVAAFAMAFASERLHLDLARNRYCVFHVLAVGSRYRELPPIAYIGIRDVTYRGGDEDGSWGNTYTYEVFLMDDDNGKLVVCHRTGKGRIRAIVQELAQRSGARVVDRTREGVMTTRRGRTGECR